MNNSLAVLRLYLIIISFSIVAVVPVLIVSQSINKPRYYYNVSCLELPKISLPPDKGNINAPQPESDIVLITQPETFYPLYAQNEKKSVPIASLTKIMTAIVAIETYDPADTVTISVQATQLPPAKINLIAGEKMKVRDLIKATLISSANDAAYSLAAKEGIEQFVSLMNTKAAILKMTQTQFFDPTGLDEKNISTAYDLALLSRWAMKDIIFRNVVKEKSAVIKSSDEQIEHSLLSTNLFYWQFANPWAIGVKTGYIPQSARCFIGWFDKDNRSLLTVVLSASNPSVEAAFIETQKYVNWSYDELRW